MRALQVDLELVKKYNQPGPRYTSYPPATHFRDRDELEDLEAEIAGNGGAARDLSLYFHLPFCQSLCWYCGCSTVITTKQSKSAIYLKYLEKEIGLIRQNLDPDRQVVQLHWGGGTPTFLTPDEIRSLGSSIRSHFDFSNELEAGVEIDPRFLTRDHVTALREAGFQRASIGVQDHDPVVQKAVHRIQPKEMTVQSVAWLRADGFNSLNLDLIYGLPYQTPETFQHTLDDVLEIRPDRLAVFSYAHVPWLKPAQKALEKKCLPSPEMKLELLKLTIETLTAHGYTYIGMDHFALETDELALAQAQGTLQRNFQGYSTRGGADIYAFGMSSISQAEELYWQNQKELPGYYAALDAGKLPLARGYIMTGEDKIRRKTIMRLMCDLSLDYGKMSKQLGLDFEAHFAGELASLDSFEEDGLIEREPGRFAVTNRGRLFIRNIAMQFDAYQSAAKEIAGREQRYSKTI
jgi:oxygen-independent coproporphyrinogen III oxidase